MEILIKKKNNIIDLPKSINFTELVKNCDITLSIGVQSMMIDLLNEEFTEAECNWYIINLYMFLNYHPTIDFPVNLENVYIMIGFANKGNAMKTIKGNFTIDVDYKILLIPSEKQVKTNGGAGLNKEEIMLNIETFKTLCMVARTKKGKEIRNYYLKLENIHNKVIKIEMEQQKLTLQKEKDAIDILLKEKDRELDYTKKELQKISVCTIKKWFNVEPGDTVYGFRNIGEPYIKLGKAENIKKREDGYTVGNRNSDIFYYRKCHNCKLTEKVLHHILDKYRLQSNREWFDISEELAIYTIDLVCNFLDSFIGCSEELINLKVNEQLSICLEQAGVIKIVQTDDKIHDKVIEVNETIEDVKLNEIVNPQEEHFKQFINEYCIVSTDSKCVALNILGAYRMWNKKTDMNSRKNLTTYMKNNYTIQQEYSNEHNTKFTYYIGVEPKEFIINREDEINLPIYEEFILSECKFDYTYRSAKSNLYSEFKIWFACKYPEYNFSKNEQTHMESYLNRRFLNCKKTHLLGGTNGYYGIQMKDDQTEILGIVLSKRKKVYKVNCITKEIIDTYNTLSEAADKCGMDQRKLSPFILKNTVIDDSHFYTYTNAYL